MEKRHISRVMLWETIYTAILSLLFGIACGILFSKLVFLGLLKILKMEVVIGVEVSAFTLAETIGLFTVIFLLIFFNSVRLIYMVRPAELLKGGQIGEKMPKTKWPLAVLGIVTLAGGYILALKADNVMTGLNTFFVAVLLVIVGTFSLFMAGSIAFLKLLQKNKRYYYKNKSFYFGFRNDLSHEAECGQSFFDLHHVNRSPAPDLFYNKSLCRTGAFAVYALSEGIQNFTQSWNGTG